MAGSGATTYRVFDADNHYYEPIDLFERYVESSYRDRTFTTEQREDGTVVLFRGRPFGFVGGSGNRVRIRPGSLRAMMRGEALPETEDDDDSYAADPTARLEMMDRQGIDATLMFPSTGVTITNAIGDDVELRAVHMRAFNRWREHVYVSPHHYGEDIAGLVDLLGPDRVMFGSDFPHAEGMSGVEDYQERTQDFVDRLRRDDETTRRVMHDNGLHLLGVGA